MGQLVHSAARDASTSVEASLFFGLPPLTGASCAREHHPRRAASIAATSIFFMVIIASNARLASSPPAAIASVSTRGVICHDTPHLSLHQPQALSSPPLPTMAFQ